MSEVSDDARARAVEEVCGKLRQGAGTAQARADTALLADLPRGGALLVDADFAGCRFGTADFLGPADFTGAGLGPNALDRCAFRGPVRR